jgi:hypothetical protein
MATYQREIMSYKFNWGDAVKVITNAPEKYLRVEKGSVCGIYEVITKAAADSFCVPVGTVLYLVENLDGISIEISEKYLEPISK